MLDKELGRKIRSMRKARAITLDVLTMRTGLSTGYLSKIERGLSSPPIATLTPANGNGSRAKGRALATITKRWRISGKTS